MRAIPCLLTRLVILWLVISAPAVSKSASSNAGFDIVTMSNGDIHQGTVAVEFLSVQTSFSKLSIPYHHLLKIKIGKNNQPDQINTRSGEFIIGKVLDSEMTMLRVLDSTLPLDTNNIASVTFASRNIGSIAESSTDSLTDILKTPEGSQLLGHIVDGDIILKSRTSMQIINRKQLHFIDIASAEDSEEPLAQVTLVDGKIYQGQLTLASFKFETRYDQTIELPIKAISELRYAIKTATTKADFTHRWTKPPASLFRDKMVDGSPAPEMIVIKGGEFIRGDAQGDEDERPPVPVKLKGFAIGVFEVSFNEYDLFCDDTGREHPSDEDWKRGRRPVINVSWKDATAYTQWLSKKTRQRYRLPTDAEWEYAARAGTQTTYWWGDKVEKAKANCEGCTSLWDGTKTSPTGKFSANPLGLHDTAGNVFEWVADCFHDHFSEAPADGSAVEKPGCGKRVIRGGAWSFPAKEIRSANRWRDFPSRRSDDTGFRVARDL